MRNFVFIVLNYQIDGVRTSSDLIDHYLFKDDPNLVTYTISLPESLNFYVETRSGETLMGRSNLDTVEIVNSIGHSLAFKDGHLDKDTRYITAVYELVSPLTKV